MKNKLTQQNKIVILFFIIIILLICKELSANNLNIQIGDTFKYTQEFETFKSPVPNTTSYITFNCKPFHFMVVTIDKYHVVKGIMYDKLYKLEYPLKIAQILPGDFKAYMLLYETEYDGKFSRKHCKNMDDLSVSSTGLFYLRTNIDEHATMFPKNNKVGAVHMSVQNKMNMAIVLQITVVDKELSIHFKRAYK